MENRRRRSEVSRFLTPEDHHECNKESSFIFTETLADEVVRTISEVVNLSPRQSEVLEKRIKKLLNDAL